MSEGVHWPAKGQRAFIPGEFDQSFYPKESGKITSRAFEFRHAAELILKNCLGDDCSHGRDHLFFPIAYLYRHCIELHLKAIINTGVQMRKLDREKTEDAMRDHSLARLWNHARELLLDRWREVDPAPLKATESIINELHQADPSGQIFRYESGNDGLPFIHDKLPDRICPDQFFKTMSGVCNFLEATSGELEENLRDMWACERQSGD